MKDLLVYAADADAMAFMRAMLGKPQALGIPTISFDIERHLNWSNGSGSAKTPLRRTTRSQQGN